MQHLESHQELQNTTKIVVEQFMLIKTRNEKVFFLKEETKILLKKVEEMEIKHMFKLKHMVNKLNLSTYNVEAISNLIADEIFKAPLIGNQTEVLTITWERIVSLCSFYSLLAIHCESKGICSDQDVTKWLQNALIKHIKWMANEGGWKTFIETFSETDLEANIFKVLGSISIVLLILTFIMLNK